MISGEGPTKECFKCYEVLPLSEFYRHPRMTDGHLGKCKRCARRDSRENRERNRDYYLAYDRSRVAGKVAGVRRSIAKHPHKNRARVHVHNALARGKMQRQPCEVCGIDKADAHHEDYDKPLEVRWLCRKHHGEVHRIDT